MDFLSRLFGFASEVEQAGGYEVRHIPVKSNIKVETIRESVPEFKRTYSGVLSNNARIDIGANYCDIYNKRRFGVGTLTQPNGRSIYFFVDDIADKILDPQLVPLVVDFVNVAKAMDSEYDKELKKSFVDKSGKTWVLGGVSK